MITEEQQRPRSDQSRSKPRQRHGLLAWFSALGTLLVVLPLAWLPASLACGFARMLAVPAWFLARRRRKVTLSNLRHAFGSTWSEKKIHSVGLESWRRVAVSAVEAIQIQHWLQDPRFVDSVIWSGPWDQLDQRQKQGEAFLLVSGHQGPFEVILPLLVQRGWRLGLLSRPVKNAYIDGIMKWLRGATVASILDPAGALPEMGRALRSGTSLALLIDQNTRDGVFVNFFGRAAATTPSIGVLTRRYQVPVIYLQARRLEAGKRYRIHCEIADLPWGEDIRSHVLQVTAATTTRIESMIRETPADGLWLHQRWKVRPDGTREILI